MEARGNTNLSLLFLYIIMWIIVRCKTGTAGCFPEKNPGCPSPSRTKSDEFCRVCSYSDRIISTIPTMGWAYAYRDVVKWTWMLFGDPSTEAMQILWTDWEGVASVDPRNISVSWGADESLRPTHILSNSSAIIFVILSLRRASFLDSKKWTSHEAKVGSAHTATSLCPGKSQARSSCHLSVRASSWELWGSSDHFFGK
jgi:hypothetical protein